MPGRLGDCFSFERLKSVAVTGRFWNVVDELTQPTTGGFRVDLRRCNGRVAEKVSQAHEIGVELKRVDAEFVSQRVRVSSRLEAEEMPNTSTD